VFSYILKSKKRGEPKTFSKRKVKVRGTSIVEVGELLELCSCSRKLYESWLQKFFKNNNYPLVQFHCIIKIMCQGLPLGCLQCLLVCTVQDRNFGCSVRFYIFYWNVKMVLIIFALSFYTNFLSFLISEEFFKYISMVNVQIATDCSVFDRFCFWCIVCLFWWNYQFISVD